MAGWLPAAVAGLLPVVFVPTAVDAYILPRVVLTLVGAGLLTGAGLLAGSCTLGSLRLPALAVATAAVLAAAFSVAPALSLAGGYGRYESLPVRLAYLGLFCGALWLGGRERVVSAFLAGCAVASVETLYQAATGALPRPDGNLGQPNLVGALLAMAIPLAVGRALTLRGRWPPSGFAWWAWLGLAGLFGLALIACTSRSGWLGAIAGLGVAAVLLVPARHTHLIAVAAAAGLVAAVALLLLSPLRALNQDTGQARLGVWRDSLVAVGQRPLVGWGEDATAFAIGSHQSADWEPGHNFDRAHSMPLDLAVTQGVVGLAACTWLFAAWWRGMWRRRTSVPALAGFGGAGAAYLTWAMLNFDWAPATAAFWLLAGTAQREAETSSTPVGAERGARDAGRPDGSRGTGPPWRPAAALAVLAAGLVLGVPPLLADLAYYAGDVARAAAIAPLQPRYQTARGDLAGLRAAAALGDPDPGTYVRLGDAELAAGNRPAARAAYERALSLYPYDPEVRRRLAADGGS